MIESAKELDRKRDVLRTVLAYKRLFQSADGKLVLADFRKAFGMEMPAFIPNASGYDPLHAAVRDGQRSVLLHIQAKLEAATEADGNNDKPKTKVIK
jgi:hypothetical protein